MEKIVGLSLFSNIGVAEAYCKEIGVKIAIANELVTERAIFYKDVYPDTKMIIGDITDDTVFKEIVTESKKKKVDFIIATPPCQGMSTAGRHRTDDPRNFLVFYAIKAIKEIKPKYVLLENVPQQLKTKIVIGGEKMMIPDYIRKELSSDYEIKNTVVSALDYGVAQMRQRSIFLMTSKRLNINWDFIKESEKSTPKTLKETIGHLPSLDPRIQGVSIEEQLKLFPDYEEKKKAGLLVSPWHFPPTHKLRHITAMIYTPEGQSALKNEKHFPLGPDGKRVTGYSNTYKRQWWDKPAYTVTTYNGAVCSHDNVHPGKFIGLDHDGCAMYSDARVLSIYELMLVMSIPSDWPIPKWANESLIRHAIGEGIPPLIIKKLLLNLIKEIEQHEK